MKNVQSIFGQAKRLSTAGVGLLFIVIAIALSSCEKDDDEKPKYTDAQIEAMVAQIKQFTQSDSIIRKNLATFDELDFTVFSNQQWARLHESHAQNIKVTMPDGSVTVGLDAHLAQLKFLFMHAPDTRIKQHPISFGSGKYTAVTGQMEGTFTKPLTLPNGVVIQPTGKAFKLPMVTIGLWENGVMIEEQLFYDNQTYFAQMGIQ